MCEIKNWDNVTMFTFQCTWKGFGWYNTTLFNKMKELILSPLYSTNTYTNRHLFLERKKSRNRWKNRSEWRIYHSHSKCHEFKLLPSLCIFHVFAATELNTTKLSHTNTNFLQWHTYASFAYPLLFLITPEFLPIFALPLRPPTPRCMKCAS